jgi:hypothetical protein
MNDAREPYTTREKPRVNSNVGAGVHGDSAGKQNRPDQPLLRTICIRFVSSIKRPIDRKTTFV